MNTQSPTNRFRDWGDDDIDRFIMSVQCILNCHDMPPERIGRYLLDVTMAEQELDRRQDFHATSWDDLDLTAILSRFKRME